MLTGVTLAIGVANWIVSPIKFQADMGILLAFMFLWNMLGALILLPALAHFILKSIGQKGHDSDTLKPTLPPTVAAPTSKKASPTSSM